MHYTIFRTEQKWKIVRITNQEAIWTKHLILSQIDKIALNVVGFQDNLKAKNGVCFQENTKTKIINILRLFTLWCKKSENVNGKDNICYVPLLHYNT